MGKRDNDRRDRDDRPAPVDPIRAATPKPETVQRDAVRDVREPDRPETPRGPDPVGYGNNRWGDSPPSSLSSMSGGGLTQSDTRPKPDPEPQPEKPKPETGRSKARGSELALNKGRPAGQTKQDAPARKKEPPREQRDTRKARKDARPEGQTKQDAPRIKREVVCKAPPTGKETRPKGGAGSGKRFVPYIGSKACK